MELLPIILTALANMGTPFILSMGFHLVFGNAIIGFIEGVILAKYSGCKRRRAIPILIAANYASAWIGWYFLTEKQFYADVTVENVKFWFYLSIGIAFLLTLVVEFPFFWCAAKHTKSKLSHLIKGIIMIHCVSYLAMMAWYWLVSGASMMNDLEVVDRNEIVPTEEYILYYISTDGESVMSLDLKENGWEESQNISNLDKIFRENKRHRLTVYPSKLDSEKAGYDLYLRPLYMRNDEDRGEFIKASITDRLPIELSDSGAAPFAFDGKRFGKAASWQTGSDWEFKTGFWAIEGITVTNVKTNERFRFAQESPIASWFVTYAIQLEDDIAIFQLGEDQICILEVETRKIAIVTRGTSPIVTKVKRRKAEE